MAVYAIGDIQGCYEELQLLLQTIRFNADVDRLWFCGDLVNRGPRSLETLEYIHALRDNAVVVLGNHDLHLLAAYYHHGKTGRKDTLHDIMSSPRSELLLDWLRHQSLFHTDRELGVSLVHAGLHPDWSIDTAARLAREVEAVLQSDRHIAFYRHMYGDKPRYWSEGLDSWARLRFITNILTRIRYFTSQLKTALNQKGAPGKQPDGLVPWFDVADRKSRDERIIFGHWSTLALVDRDYPNVFPIDHGCLWGGRLVALRIDTEPFELADLACSQQQKPAP